LVGGHLLKGISGGEKKRTSIAFELISDPQVVILDEPTSGIDSLTSYIIINELKTLAKEGRTIILTIHQPNS
jgi:ABC-type multidrug transport system ATPase subunit